MPNIVEKAYIKYLRIYIDKYLNWGPQILQINNIISKNLAILYKLRHVLSIVSLKQIYYSLMYPYLQYGIMTWGSTYKSRLTKLKTKQNKCIRCIFFANNRETRLSYFSLLELLTVDCIYKFKISPFAHKISYH